MELSLSLGDTPPKKPFFPPTKIIGKKLELGFCMAVANVCANAENLDRIETVRPPVQLDLLPFSPVHRTQQPSPFPWLNNNLVSEPGSNRSVGDNEEGELFENGNNVSRKKLRLTKEQAAFLEQSFKEHSTLNLKEKKALAKQLNLRTRQVEVWFQNRRARTKLKKTGVDCEHLKRCCETLTQENRKLQKEIEELRALNNNDNKPFYMQRPPTTLTMCPSCQKVVTTTATTANHPARLTNACAQH